VDLVKEMENNQNDKIIDTPSEFKYIASFLMFNFDLIFLRQGLEPNVALPINFDTLVRKIIALIIEYKKLI